MIYPLQKSYGRQSISNQTTQSHPHFFEQLNDNLKMRYLAIKQRINSDQSLPLDEKKKSSDQLSRGYLQLRQLTKQLQFVCLKESISTSFIEAYEIVITSQQLPLSRIRQLLLHLKQSFEDQTSYFQMINKDMQRRKELLHKIIIYLKKFQELTYAQNREVIGEPMNSFMPIIYDQIQKAVQKLCQYRDTTLEMLEKIAHWKESLSRIMIGNDEDKKEEVMKKVFFMFNDQNIMGILSNETQKLCNTFLKDYIPFKEDAQNDPLMLHPYKLASMSDDKTINRPPFNLLFNMNRKYVQRLSKSQFFFKKQLENYLNRQKKQDEHPQFKIYSKIFSKRFYQKAIKRGKIKQQNSVAIISKQFDTDSQNQDHFLPMLSTQSYQIEKFRGIKRERLSDANQFLPEPEPRAKSRVRIKPPLPNFKKMKTQPDILHEQFRELVKLQIKEKEDALKKYQRSQNYINIKNLDKDPISQRIENLNEKPSIQTVKYKSTNSFALSNNVISIAIGDKSQKTNINVKKQTSISPTVRQKKPLSLYKYDLLTSVSSSKPTERIYLNQQIKHQSSKVQVESLSHQKVLNKQIQSKSLTEEIISQQSFSSIKMKAVDISLQYQEPLANGDKNKSQSPIQISPKISAVQSPSIMETDSILSLKPIVSLPQPQSQIVGINSQQFYLKQISIHDWQFSEYIAVWKKKKYFFSSFQDTKNIQWENLYVYELKGKCQEAYSILITKKVRGFYKSCTILSIVFICCSTLEILNQTIQMYKQILINYKVEHQVILQVEREKVQPWFEETLKELLFEKQGSRLCFELRNKNEKSLEIKPLIQVQIAGIMVNSESALEPNFISQDLESFSPFNFSCQGIISCLANQNQILTKNTSRQFRHSSVKQLYLANSVHTRKCHSLREINNFLEAYQLETFQEPQVGGKRINQEQVIVCAVNESMYLPFPYSLVAPQDTSKQGLTHVIFNYISHQNVDLWRRQTQKGMEQICIIKLQRNISMYFYKLEDQSNQTNMGVLPIYETKIKHIGRSSSPDRQLSKCLIQTFTKQLYGKVPCKQLNSSCIFGSLYLSFDENDLTYNSIRYNLTHTDMLYFYLPYITGICVDGDGQRYSLCEAIVNRQMLHEQA